jgi:CO dehydrogenase maturation factor
MKVAIAGKGGSGKTTIAATLARILARQGRSVLAVDDDSNPNLAVSLGLGRETAKSLPSLPRDLMVERTKDDGTKVSELSIPAPELIAKHGIAAPDGVTLLNMATVSHGGAG